MQINVLCKKAHTDWVPADFLDIEFHRDEWEFEYKAYHVNNERIVWANPREKVVAIDDGTSEGICWIVNASSIERVIDHLASL